MCVCLKKFLYEILFFKKTKADSEIQGVIARPYKTITIGMIENNIIKYVLVKPLYPYVLIVVPRIKAKPKKSTIKTNIRIDGNVIKIHFNLLFVRHVHLVLVWIDLIILNKKYSIQINAIIVNTKGIANSDLIICCGIYNIEVELPIFDIIGFWTKKKIIKSKKVNVIVPTPIKIPIRLSIFSKYFILYYYSN